MHGTTDVYEDFESVKYKIGFVPQQDLIRGSDTVYDTLENAAEMKLKANRNIKNQRIEEVFKTLGLQRERNSLVSKLSGGQRKRLSIAVPSAFSYPITAFINVVLPAPEPPSIKTISPGLIVILIS